MQFSLVSVMALARRAVLLVPFVHHESHFHSIDENMVRPHTLGGSANDALHSTKVTPVTSHDSPSYPVTAGAADSLL